ncbi:MAG: hydroxymethylbilane synthase [Actinobacteria bacterium]|nr:MAG: hydroxymethylbilane synthase [Actinomycetota bacterium]
MSAARPALRAATRGSELARWQTSHIGELLGREIEAVVVDTSGDRLGDVPIWEIGGQGVFVTEVQAAVLDGRADVAVHSAKDLPSAPTPGLVLAAIPAREDPRDALVGLALDELPTGAVVATGSVRRRAQLAWTRPDLTFAGLRGNIATRLAKAARFDAVVVALAALRRLGRTDRVAEALDPALMLPQVGQGALAVECRVGDEATLEAVVTVDHAPSRRAVEAERSFLAELGGSCDLPVGAYAQPAGGADLQLSGMVSSLDGRVMLRQDMVGTDPGSLGRGLARHLLDDCGGQAVLDDLAGTGAP